MNAQIIPLAITMMAGPQIMTAIILVTTPSPVRVSLSSWEAPGRSAAASRARPANWRTRDGVMSPLDEVDPGLWRWTVARNGIPPTMTAYALRDGGDTILVDPLADAENEGLLSALDEVVCGRVRILVTTPFHVRGSGLLWRRWRDWHEVTIFG
jgi:hypothetical protein